MFYESYVHPYVERTECGCCDIYVEVNWNRDGKFDHHGVREYIGRIYDDDYIDVDKLVAAMKGKTRLEATQIFDSALECFSY
jgi:hypothetical protein